MHTKPNNKIATTKTTPTCDLETCDTSPLTTGHRKTLCWICLRTAVRVEVVVGRWSLTRSLVLRQQQHPRRFQPTISNTHDTPREQDKHGVCFDYCSVFGKVAGPGSTATTATPTYDLKAHFPYINFGFVARAVGTAALRRGHSAHCPGGAQGAASKCPVSGERVGWLPRWTQPRCLPSPPRCLR